ncbi:MAG: SRPBCC family protein [Deltaproteobacteria bacterium]|nr:SRPBCC family protein [Deltaproteobacteria bacterium]
MIIMEDSIKIKTTPEDIFNFLKNPNNYKRWHPADHVACRWIKGNPLEKGSIQYVEEYVEGKLHKLKVIYTKCIRNKELEFKITNPIWRIFWPKSTLIIEKKDNYCVFIAKTYFRLGPISSFSKRTKKHLEAIKQHIKEEGENLKYILEKNNTL